ncbi:MAG: hypothetical protein IPM34_00915 [Saprospiraceae bacterium]|nr:hypothetical protein [Saprospiraceae bacterium]
MIFFVYLLCLIITVLQIWNTLQFKPMAGDRAVGQAWVMIFLALIFTLCTALLFFLMARKDCFIWFRENINFGKFFIPLFCLCYIIAVFFSSVFKTEWHSDSTFPYLLRFLSLGHFYIWIPLGVMLPFYFLIRDGGVQAMALTYVKYPLLLGILFSGLYSGLTLYGWLAEKISLSQTKAKNEKEVIDKFHLQNLEKIAKFDPGENIYGLLSYSFPGRPRDIREAALNKIKERPQWEEQILDVLKDRNNYPESYYYLSGNDLNHPEIFKDHIRQSIVFLSVDVGEFLKETNNYQDWILDHYHIPHMLDALEFHYKTEQSYFAENVLKLKNAIVLNTPDEAKKIRFNALISIEQWLKKHKPK